MANYRYPLNHIAITQGYSSGHTGIDFGWYTSHHQPIYAVESGTVIYKQRETNGGNVVHIRHSDGYVSAYGHMDTIIVSNGQTVTKGQQIGTMGATGNVTGEHLHFGLVRGTRITYSNDVWVNPLNYLYVYSDQEVNSRTQSNYNILYYNGTNNNPLSWIYKDAYLNQSEMENNASIIISYYRSIGINDKTIAALLGNMQRESTIEPHLTERGGGGGYGLVQWTPKSVLTNHANTLGYSPISSGNVQLKVIIAEIKGLSGTNEWYSTSAFISNYYNSGATSDMIGITGQQFLDNSMNWSPDKLAVLFMAAYERPSYTPNINRYDLREQYALSWYSFIQSGVFPDNPDNIDNPGTSWKKKRFNFVLYRNNRRNYNYYEQRRFY